MVASDSFAEFLRGSSPRSAASDAAHVRQDRRVRDGLMFRMVTENMLYLRVDDDNRRPSREAESSPPLNYEERAPRASPSGAPGGVRRTR
jgi:DNA transformation protein